MLIPFRIRFFRVFLFFVFLSPVFGEESQVPISPFSPLRTGDVIHLTVFNNRGVGEIDRDFVVNFSGQIDVPIVGLIKVSGFNVQELESELYEVMSRVAYKKPRVQVGVTKFVLTDKVFVFGGVKNPGPINFRDNLTVMEVIKLAGGFQDIGPEIGNLAFVNTTNFLDSRAHQTAFQDSGTFDFLERTVVKRQGREITLNLKKLIQDGEISQNIEIYNNDVLLIPKRGDVVPKFEETLFILGAVNFPARYRYRKNLTVLDAITLAGGLLNPNEIRFASIIRGIRPDKKGPQKNVTSLRVDLRRLYFRGDLRHNAVLEAGDVLLVSTRKYRNVLSNLGKFVDNFLPIFTRMDNVYGYDESIRRFNDRFLK